MPRVAWRCHRRRFFEKLCAYLGSHHVWDDTIYSYALLHNDLATLREWIQHQNDFIAECGPYLSTPLIALDPVERRAYEHLEYSPLVNPRAHRLGNEARIANPAILTQYRALLDVLAHKPALVAADHMSVAYYLFLQDRIEEALARFSRVDANDLPTRLQHDYFQCYVGFYQDNLADARRIAAQYRDYPIGRWRLVFADVTRQLDAIAGTTGHAEDASPPDRDHQLVDLAASEPAVEFKVDQKTLALSYRNLTEVIVNYYLMDPEFSFSSNPFMSDDATRFGIIKPNHASVLALPVGQDTLDVPLPAEFATANVLVEVVAAGQCKVHAYHANSLKLTLAENYGRLEARDPASNCAISRAYVKVYARLKNGTIRFFKDGYTDLRGGFDYASLNGGSPVAPAPLPRHGMPGASPAVQNGLDYQMLKPAELPEIDKFAILLLSEANGTTTREVSPPSE